MESIVMATAVDLMNALRPVPVQAREDELGLLFMCVYFGMVLHAEVSLPQKT